MITLKPMEWEYRDQDADAYVVRRHWGVAYRINRSFALDNYHLTAIKHDGTILYEGDDLTAAQAACEADRLAQWLDEADTTT